MAIPPPHRLHGPVPCPVSADVLRAQSWPLQDPAHPAFTRLVSDAVAAVRRLCGTPEHRVFFQCSTATGVIEGALLNLTRPGDSVVVVTTGKFGVRLARVAERTGVTVRRVALPYGALLTDPGSVRALIDDTTKLVLAVHHETSTGAVNDPEVLRRAVEGTGVMLLLDAVSSLGVVPVDGAGWGIDVIIGSSQKGVGGTPGISFPVVSPRAMRYLEAHPPRTYALDWTLYAEKYDEGQPGGAFSPAMSLMYGFAQALSALGEESDQARAERYRRLRTSLTSALRERKFTFTLPSGDEQTGPVVVALPPYPPGAPALAKALAERNVSVGLGQGPLKGRALRFALYGQTEDSIAELVRELDVVVQTVTGEYA